MSKTLDTIHDETQTLDNVAADLTGLAYAFGRTGNADVECELVMASRTIREAAEAIRNAYFGEINAQARQSMANHQRFMGSILSGLLDGKEPKDVCIKATPHLLDHDIIEAHG